MTEPLLVPINHASAIIGRSRRSIYQLVADGRLKAVKSGSRTLLVYDSLKAYAAQLPPAKFKLMPVARSAA
jgi:excisionase family DNA binding protein